MEDTQTRLASRIEVWPVEQLLAYRSIEEVDHGAIEAPLVHPVLVDEVERTILRGGARLTAAFAQGVKQVPVIPLGGVGPRTREIYFVADERLSGCAGWSEAALQAEWAKLLEEEPPW